MQCLQQSILLLLLLLCILLTLTNIKEFVALFIRHDISIMLRRYPVLAESLVCQCALKDFFLIRLSKISVSKAACFFLIGFFCGLDYDKNQD